VDEGKNTMRNVLAIGATAIVLSLGAGAAYANGPASSPYEIIVQQPATSSLFTAPMSEGRSAVIDRDQGAPLGYAAPGATPEDMNYYSRGR
jgi:hypothetical protein